MCHAGASLFIDLVSPCCVGLTCVRICMYRQLQKLCVYSHLTVINFVDITLRTALWAQYMYLLYCIVGTTLR